jgi:sacsin
VLAADVARDYPRNPTVLQHLERTYQWLSQHVDAAQPLLRRCTEVGIPLFLNVDDPKNSSEEWIWERADHILLDEYRDDVGFLRYPRNFLKAFNSLLVAAGAVTFDYGEGVDTTNNPQEDEDQLENLRTSFDRMRKNGICTDVSFICGSPPDNEPLKAHRAYLAAYTDHFEMFSGKFSGLEARVASSESPIVFEVPDYSRKCVEYALGKSSLCSHSLLLIFLDRFRVHGEGTTT